MSHLASSRQLEEMIAFRISEQEFCVAVRWVREIRSWSPVTRIPHAPSFVLGVINLRGATLPIIDLAARLGFAPAEPTPRHAIVVVEVQDQVVGLLVEGVSDIIRVDQTTIQPTPEVASELARSYVKGIVSLDSRMISMLDLESIIPSVAAAA